MLQDNLLISEGVRVLDFGLAKIRSSELLGSFVQAETTGLIGSPFYMAPEMWSEDEEPDRRADIYSLGIILYQMLAGDVPFKGPSAATVMRKHLMSEPPAFAALGAHVPREVEAVVHHALEKDPAKRPQSMQDFITELRSAMDRAKASPEYAQLTRVDLQADTIQMSGDTTEQIVNTLRTDLPEETIVAQSHAKDSGFNVAGKEQARKIVPQGLRWAAALVLAVFLVGGGYAFYHWLQVRRGTISTIREEAAPAPAPARVAMVAIPGGTFMMG
jgi:serine/threonine protein kinase